MGSAHSSSVRIHDFTDQKRHDLSLKPQIADKIVIDLLELVRPARVAGIRLTLMHQNTLDDTVLLSQFSHLHKSCVRIIIVCRQHPLHPAGSTVCNIICNAVRKESLDMASSYGDIDDTDLDILRKGFNQSPSEIVSRCKACILAAQRRNSRVPLAFHPSSFLIIDASHHLEAFTDSFKILFLDPRITLHIRLAETEIDMEVRVLGLDCKGCNSRNE